MNGFSARATAEYPAATIPNQQVDFDIPQPPESSAQQQPHINTQHSQSFPSRSALSQRNIICKLHVYSTAIEIYKHELLAKRQKRGVMERKSMGYAPVGHLPGRYAYAGYMPGGYAPAGYETVEREASIGDIMHDLLYASFAPLTEQCSRREVRDRAIEFISAFDFNAADMYFFPCPFAHQAQWNINIESVPYKTAQVIYGLTPNSRNTTIADRFLRFRLPFVRIEWFIETPYSKIYDLLTSDGKTAKLEVSWKMWARQGSHSGMVACGISKDEIIVGTDGCPVIKERIFIITQVFQEELMTPVPYPIHNPPLTLQDDVTLFSSSQTVIQFLRSSQKRLGFLVALSALFASLQPIVDKYSTVGGWILAAVGVVAALISVIALMTSWTLSNVETIAAKQRQSRV